MSQHDTLTQALQDAASSLETISRLAGKAAHPNGDETCMGTFPEVRGYATSRAAVARAALSATQPAQAAQSEPKRCEHCDDTGDVTSSYGEWRGYCKCPHGKAVQGSAEPTLKPEQVVEAFYRHFPNTRMAQAYIGFATYLWALGVKAQRAWQSAAGADVPRLSEQDATLLAQAHDMLLELADDQRSKGNDSAAMGAECSADAVLRMGAALSARKPLPAPYRRKLWAEHEEVAATFEVFDRIVTLTESAHGIGLEVKHG